MTKFKSMGVINITPDSFSDGNQYNQYSLFQNYFQKSLKHFDVIDIGAESTAPFNQAIDAKDEMDRYQVLIQYIQENDDPKITLSLDTYKCDVFHYLYQIVKKHWKDSKLIFNDVSGKIDDDLKRLAKDLKNDLFMFFAIIFVLRG
jgi:dihydropteroate synthase